jgi:hypothetical protein
MRTAAAASSTAVGRSPYFDEVMGGMAAEGIAKGGAFVLGRRTYEDFALLARPAGGQPVHLGAQRTPEVRPLVLGSGRRLFPEGGAPITLQLVDTRTTTTGVVIATYRPSE